MGPGRIPYLGFGINQACNLTGNLGEGKTSFGSLSLSLSLSLSIEVCVCVRACLHTYIYICMLCVYIFIYVCIAVVLLRQPQVCRRICAEREGERGQNLHHSPGRESEKAADRHNVREVNNLIGTGHALHCRVVPSPRST